jgi:hypothetical protein
MAQVIKIQTWGEKKFLFAIPYFRHTSFSLKKKKKKSYKKIYLNVELIEIHQYYTFLGY